MKVQDDLLFWFIQMWSRDDFNAISTYGSLFLVLVAGMSEAPSEDRQKTERQSEMEIWVRNFIHVHVMSLRRLVSLVQYDDTRGEETSTSPASHSVLLGNGTRRNTSRAGLTYVSKTSRPPLCHVKVGGWRQHCTVSSHQGAIGMRLSSSACITSRNGEWSRVLSIRKTIHYPIRWLTNSQETNFYKKP